MPEKHVTLTELENRINMLEELLTHQAVLIDELSEQLMASLAEQGKTRATFERQQKALLARVLEVEESDPSNGGHNFLAEKPPHY